MKAARGSRAYGIALVGALLAAQGLWAADYAFVEEPGEGDHTIAFDVPAPGSWPEGAELRVVFDRRSETSCHVTHLTREAAWFEEGSGAEARRLGHSGVWPVLAGQVKVSVKRRAWEMEVLCNGRHVVSAWDEEPLGGQVGLAAKGVPLSADDVSVQPVEPPSLTDDFMRGRDEPNPWETVSGQWQTMGLAGGKGQLRADLSANPFSLRCTGPGVQLTKAGDWYWDSYEASVAVKATQPNGAIGLAFYVQDARNYYLLSLGGAGQGDSAPLRLTKVVDGETQLLDATSGSYEKDVWYKLAARVSNGVIEAYLDGQPCLQTRDATFGQGPIGLWALNAGDGWFDDVEVRPWWAFADPLDSGDLSAWHQASGRWAAGAGALCAASSPEHPASATTGPTSWTGYEVTADVVAGDAKGVGLYACAADATNWYLFQWSQGTPTGSWRLLRMVKGQLVTLGSVPGGIDRNSPQHMSLAVANGLIDCRVGDQPVIVAADFALTHGAAGLRADGGEGVAFQNVTVRGVDEPYRPVTIAAQFAKEDTMTDWARPGSDWPRDLQTGARWFRLPFFNDLSVRIPFRLGAGGQSRLALRIGSVAQEQSYVAGGPQLTTAGVEVECLGVAGGAGALTCRRGGAIVAQAPVTIDASEHSLRVDKVGAALRAWLDGQPVLAVNDATWLDNSGLGLACEGAALSPDRIETYSTHMPEYTFSGAPTDWRPKLGVWQVTDRWSCFPGWAWFGGSKHKSPLLWSKHQFYGDQTFEFWGALEMDTSPQQGGYTHPSDINCTIAGDGENLCSGYSFVFAGDNNTATKILRGNTVVAQTNDAKFVNPNTGNLNFHRHWFHVKAVKLGPSLFMSVDDKWVLSFQDPQPLTGGHVAVWSYNNGILIARARATAQFVR